MHLASAECAGSRRCTSWYARSCMLARSKTRLNHRWAAAPSSLRNAISMSIFVIYCARASQLAIECEIRGLLRVSLRVTRFVILYREWIRRMHRILSRSAQGLLSSLRATITRVCSNFMPYKENKWPCVNKRQDFSDDLFYLCYQYYTYVNFIGIL